MPRRCEVRSLRHDVTFSSVRTTAREFINPVEYRHPSDSMARPAETFERHRRATTLAQGHALRTQPKTGIRAEGPFHSVGGPPVGSRGAGL